MFGFFEKLLEGNLSKINCQNSLKFFLMQECGGMMTLPDVYCRVNRARGLELISPEDLLNACQMLEHMNLPIA